MAPITLMDVYKVMGLFTSIILTATFFWMRYLKNEFREIIKENKKDMREMIKDMQNNFEARLAIRWEGQETRFTEMIGVVEQLRNRYNAHYDKYHSREK
jgi:hypothetical protein